MKKLIFGLLALCSLLAIPACDGKKDKDNDSGKVEVTLTESADQIVLKAVSTDMGITFTTVYEWNFEKDVCVSCYMRVTYPSALIAQQVYEEILEDEEEEEDAKNYSVSGAVLSHDSSAYYQGMSKAAIRKVAESLKTTFENEES